MHAYIPGPPVCVWFGVSDCGVSSSSADRRMTCEWVLIAYHVHLVGSSSLFDAGAVSFAEQLRRLVCTGERKAAP
jgi:hypothetical protein